MRAPNLRSAPNAPTTGPAAKQRILAALTQPGGGPSPLWIPTVGVTVELMAAAGAPWPRAHHDAELMARLALAPYALGGCPCCTVPFCLTVEAEAFGAVVDLGALDRHPQVVRPVTMPPEALVLPADFLRRGRIPVVLEAVRRLAAATGDSQPVNAKIAGPFTVACNLFGPHVFLRWTIRQPHAVSQVLEVVSDGCIALARAAVACGADVVTVADPTASASLLSRAMYERFVFPVHKKVFSSLAAPRVLHMCGDTTHHLPLIAALPLEGFSFENLVGVAEAKRALGPRIAAIGNLSPVALLENGSPAAIAAGVDECLASGVDVVASGCALTLDTPLSNIHALAAAVSAASGAGRDRCL